MRESYQDFCRRVTEQAAKDQRTPTRRSALMPLAVVMAFACLAALAGRWMP